jgi:SAM-dependent methyltransferase
LGDTGHAQIVQADFSSSSWWDKLDSSQAFDLIVSGFAIHHQENTRKRALYAEIYGRLSPGGVFLNLEHVASATPAVEAIAGDLFVDYLYAYHQIRHPERSRDEVATRYYSRPDKAENKLTPVEVQCDWLRQTGFLDVDCFFRVFELALFGGRKPK